VAINATDYCVCLMRCCARDFQKHETEITSRYTPSLDSVQHIRPRTRKYLGAVSLKLTSHGAWRAGGWLDDGCFSRWLGRPLPPGC
jgi:hypothetical protein